MAIARKAAVNSGISGAASHIPIGPTRTRSHDKAPRPLTSIPSGRLTSLFPKAWPAGSRW
jgi:hypothetical protein